MTSIAGEEPATKASRGVHVTFTELFRRYFAQLYDFALRLARDQEIAALAVQEGFLAAWTAIQEGEAPEAFKQVLFANAHNSLALYLRKRRVRVATAANEPFAAMNESERPDPAVAQDLAAIAWQCAAELRLDDYELLDLRLRRGWDPAEIAAMLQARPDLVERRLARVRADFEGAFAAKLLESRPRSCLELDVLAGDEPWSPGLRRRVAQHLAVCPACQETRQHYPAGSDVIGALSLAQAPSGWEDAILARLQEAVGSGGTGSMVLPAEPSGPPREPGSGETPAAATGSTKRSAGRASRRSPGAIMLLSGGFLVLALFVGGMCATGAFHAGSGAPTSHNVTTARTAGAAPTAAATSTAAPPTATPTRPPTPTAVPPHKKGKPG